MRSFWPATLLNRKYYNIIIDRVVRLLHNFSPKRCWKRKKIKGCWTNHHIATWLEKLQSMPHCLFLTPAYLHYQQHLRYQTKPAFLFLHIRLFFAKNYNPRKSRISCEFGSRQQSHTTTDIFQSFVCCSWHYERKCKARSGFQPHLKFSSIVVWFFMFGPKLQRQINCTIGSCHDWK